MDQNYPLLHNDPLVQQLEVMANALPSSLSKKRGERDGYSL